MDTLVQFFQTIGFVFVGNVRSKVLLVLGVIFFVQVFHVFTNVSSHDAFTVHIGIVFLGITIVTGESLFGVGNIQTTIGGSLQGSKDTASRGGGSATDIQQTAERLLVFIDFVNVVHLLVVFGSDNVSVHFRVSFVSFIKTDLLQETTSHQKTSAVGGGVVLQTSLEAVSRKLRGGSLAEDAITIDERVHNLADHLTIGETNDQTVLGRLVLVLGLADQAFSLTVVRLTFTATTELDLVSRVVRFVGSGFDKHHGDYLY
mmetsp:Transcript_4389/g.9415  ORF Transcript_4389/g.9415 Transcript_4389/m.9415 type:complete len:259 (+) Transcript_4389:231-1007(+)